MSTPARFMRQMESVSANYDYALLVSGSVVCVNLSSCDVDIAPISGDSTRSQMKGKLSLEADLSERVPAQPRRTCRYRPSRPASQLRSPNRSRPSATSY